MLLYKTIISLKISILWRQFIIVTCTTKTFISAFWIVNLNYYEKPVVEKSITCPFRCYEGL